MTVWQAVISFAATSAADVASGATGVAASLQAATVTVTSGRSRRRDDLNMVDMVHFFARMGKPEDRSLHTRP
jgi:hypothetical protein